jgi:hypothetical protein
MARAAAPSTGRDRERRVENMAGNEGRFPRAAAGLRARRRQILRAPRIWPAACARSREVDGGGSRLDGRQAAGAHVWMGGQRVERASRGESDGRGARLKGRTATGRRRALLAGATNGEDESG